MAAKLGSYDTVAELLSINNTINVATLVGACFFGLLTVYGCLLTWRHQRWERQLERRRGVDTADDGLEAGTHSEGYCMGDLNPQLVGETAVGRRSDDTDADSVKLARPSLAAGQGEHEPTGMDDMVHGDDESIHRHIGGSGASLRRADDVQPGYWESLAESDDTTLAHATFSQMVDTNNTTVAAFVSRAGASDTAERGT